MAPFGMRIGAHQTAQLGEVLWMYALEPVLEALDPDVSWQSDQFVPTRREVGPVGGGVPVPDAVIRPVDRQRIAFLYLDQRLFRTLTLYRIQDGAV